jgi:tetratricopeptide (TPR) repeat protein
MKPAASFFVAIGIATVVRVGVAADAPTPAQALGLTPIQSQVEYTTPTKDEISQCTIRPEKENRVTSWVVRNKQGEILRRFADTNNDNVVDQWCYFLNGIEVYRDIDSNYNGKADEYRWFNTAGTRWGIDKNEDGRIDSWRVISPHEVAEQAILALKTRDPARFQLLLMTPDEVNSLGFGKERAESVTASIKAAPSGFSKLMNEQKVVSPKSRYIDFGSARPSTIPAGTGGSTKDIIICDNGAALAQTDDKHEQIFLGTLVAVGDAWKLIDAPSDNQGQNGGYFLAAPNQQGAGQGSENAPSEEMQQQMAELEKLDKESDSLPPEQLAANIDKRVAVLQKLAEIAPAADRDQWNRQLIDVLSVAIQSGNYPQGIARLADLQKSLEEAKADTDIIGHAVFQRMWAEYALNQQNAPADTANKLQEKWLADLDQFVGQYPKSGDTAEALYQLGLYQEIMGKSDEAIKKYQQLQDSFPNSRPAEKAKGALRRLTSLGRPMTLRGTDMLVPGRTVDLTSQYRGKVVLIHYWATMDGRWKDDIDRLKEVNAKRGGRDFDIIGVCLDDDPKLAKEYFAQNKSPWKQIYEKGGLDGRLANEMGVITLPLMVLVDQNGNVANQNVQMAQLDGELAKLIKPAGGTANALRSSPTSR